MRERGVERGARRYKEQFLMVADMSCHGTEQAERRVAMNLRNAVEFGEKEAERAELTISWLERHAGEIGDPAAVSACIRTAAKIRERRLHVADLFRQLEEDPTDAEPVTFDLTPSRKRR